MHGRNLPRNWQGRPHEGPGSLLSAAGRQAPFNQARGPWHWWCCHEVGGTGWPHPLRVPAEPQSEGRFDGAGRVRSGCDAAPRWFTVTGRVWRAALYRVRATLHMRWGGYLAVVLFVGLVGGVAMGAMAGARRTQSAFPAYLAAKDTSDLEAQIWNLGESLSGAATANLAGRLARLPHVQHVASAPTLLLLPLGPGGKPAPSASAYLGNEVNVVGSDGGMYFRQDGVSVAEGRMANPGRADQMVATTEAAKLSRWHVGETVPFGAYTVQQASSPTFSPATTKPAARVSVKLVGLVVFPAQVARDDVDRYPTVVLMTPALTQRLHPSETLPLYGLRLEHGSQDVPAVEREIIHFLPRRTTQAFHVTSVVTGQVERASRPEAIALGVFGAIAGAATLLIAGLAISRGLWANDEDLGVLRALGADPVTMTADAGLGLLGAVVLGSVAAAGVAVALSPLTPIGSVRQVDPSPGFAIDWTVLGAGFAVLVAGLGALTIALAYRRATRPYGDRHEPAERASSVVSAAERTGLPAPAVAGLRFSLESGHGRTAVPVRSVLAGAVLAVMVVVATVTFGSGLSTLNSHPALYGWNWNYAISETTGGGHVPPIAGRLLDHDPDVAAWTGFNYGDAQIDGQTVPELDGPTHAALSPPILSGHPLDANNQVVLGAATLAALHKKVGDTVVVSYGSPQDAPVYIPPSHLVIVGTATMPAIGTSGTLHPSMGTGALFATDIEPAAFRRATTSPDPNLDGPAIEVVRLRGVTPAAGLDSLQRIAGAANKVLAADPNSTGDSVDVLGVQRPAEIVNYQSTGATPVILASGLAVGAVAALGLTLAASVRRRRRDLALLKTLGFTQRQLATAVAWQASIAAITGVVVGVPAGIALGRWLWDLFARDIYAVPEPSVPVLQVMVVALGALVLAVLAAAIPGRIAARTPTALVLRAE